MAFYPGTKKDTMGPKMLENVQKCSRNCGSRLATPSRNTASHSIFSLKTPKDIQPFGSRVYDYLYHLQCENRR
ncbi:MAG TPA: hypothetical protein DEB39_15580 [Planctomycetaceae bacterium]|nr:hypothetical protein [Planctomycetaceae bacterium]